MSTTEALARREEIEAEASPDALLAFLTITHPNLITPIRVVSDVKPYVLDGDRYEGMPFDCQLVTDGEGQSQTELRIQNVDRRLSEAARAVTGRAKVTLELRSSADFDLTVEPRVSLGSFAPLRGFRNFELRDLVWNQIELRGRLMLHDYTVEPYPGIRAIQSRFPGLFFS